MMSPIGGWHERRSSITVRSCSVQATVKGQRETSGARDEEEDGRPHLFVPDDEHLVTARVSKLADLVLVAVAEEDAERVAPEPLAELLAPVGRQADGAHDEDLADAAKEGGGGGEHLGRRKARADGLRTKGTHTPCRLGSA